MLNEIDSVSQSLKLVETVAQDVMKIQVDYERCYAYKHARLKSVVGLAKAHIRQILMPVEQRMAYGRFDLITVDRSVHAALTGIGQADTALTCTLEAALEIASGSSTKTSLSGMLSQLTSVKESATSHLHLCARWDLPELDGRTQLGVVATCDLQADQQVCNLTIPKDSEYLLKEVTDQRMGLQVEPGVELDTAPMACYLRFFNEPSRTGIANVRLGVKIQEKKYIITITTCEQIQAHTELLCMYNRDPN